MTRRMGGEAYSSIFFQNANNSVRVTDDFMRAVIEDKDWVTHRITTGEPVKSYRARDLMKKIAEAAWQCGDPGMQFHTTDQQVAYLESHRAHQRLEPLQRVHVPG